MTHYTFNFNNETWGTADFQWYGGDGSPSLGCMWADGSSVAFDAVSTAISGVSIPVDVDDPLSFRVRITGDWSSVSNSWSAALVISGGLVAGNCTKLGGDFTFTDNDTGWVEVTGAVTTAGTVTGVTFNMGDPALSDWITGVYLDSVYIAETPPTGPTARRYLGMGFDNANLYLTAVNDGVLTLEYFALSLPGTILDTFTFGTVAYTDPDTYTRAIYPAVVADSELYLYGRDGSAVQVQYNDLNGTAGWVDVGPGTATWGTAKFCVALMPQPFAPRNLIAAFADDDMYHTVIGVDGGWEKMGDAGTALRTAGRVTTSFHQVLVAGQGTAEMYYSPNYGASFEAGSTGLAGTVNAIEVSR